MVSTRGIKFKFTEGEKVLCYEPDPTKAKVLYNSKVLEVFYNKDAKSKKQVEYLIHFQGWNASWDRRVTEEYVLKDTEENRILQKDLADKANIKLSMKSNRVLIGSGSQNKKRKRRLSDTIREAIERERKKASESDTSSQTGTLSTEEDTDSVSSSGVESTENDPMDLDDKDEIGLTNEEVIEKHIPLNLPQDLKDILEKDFYFINENNKLVELPSSMPVLCILEDYVRFFAVRYLSKNKARRRTESREKEMSFMSLELCQEVMDGVRVCFDFYVNTLLLYPRERQQANYLKKMAPLKISRADSQIGGPPKGISSTRNSVDESTSSEKHSSTNKDDKKSETTPRRALRSNRSLPEDPVEDSSQTPQQVLSCESGRSTPTTMTSGGTSCLDGNFAVSESLLAKIKKEFNIDSDWTLLPEAYHLPGCPVLLYGSIHLLRLFVKMPEILYRMNLAKDRKKIILHHLELFLEYLSMNSKTLFSDSNYVPYSEY